jgi:DNA invertase Pin-like site-specific DNA recombinase
MTSPHTPAAMKVTADHLRRDAYLYVRQSTIKQVLFNTESTLRQYDLRGRATALGWTANQIVVIDTDQGQSGATATDRDGFQRLVADVSMGRAGIVLGLEVSRLARNNADWHRLLEICALSGTLILDEDGLYDPREFNDRMLLGMKGQLSECELHVLKSRLRGGVLSKARRGELIQPLPVGMVYTSTGKIVLDPDTGVQQAVRHLFTTFTATGSAFATVKAFAAEELRFPRRLRSGERKGDLVWGPLEHSRVLQVLHNPCYAGAFCYGRHTHHRLPGGKTAITTLPQDQWTVLIPEHHPGYISWADFEANQNRLAELSAAHSTDRRHGPPREGPALLQGLVICGVCGRRMTVRYHTRRDTQLPDYVCQYDGIRTATPICQTIPGAGIDTAIGQLLIDTLTPLALETTLTVADELATRADDADRLRATTVQRAQHHADAARRRYLAVDPTNRLVADTLEADWNNALRELTEATDAYERAKASTTGPLNKDQRARITALAADIPALWNDPATPVRERKRMVRLLIEDVTLRRTDATTAQVRLKGGQTHTLTLPLPLASWQLRKTPPEVVKAIDDLLDEHTDAQIAAILTSRGLASGTGQSLYPRLIRQIRDAYRLRSHTQRLLDDGLVSLNEIARRLHISPSTVKHWRNNGLLTGRRANDKGEYLYHMPPPDLPRPHIGRPPRTPALTHPEATRRASAGRHRP